MSTLAADPSTASTASSTPSASSSPPSPVHLVVCCHGLWGDPAHVSYIVKALVKKYGAEVSPESAEETKEPERPKEVPNSGQTGDSLGQSTSTVDISTDDASDTATSYSNMVILNTASNRSIRTYDGIDWCSERIVQEIERETLRLSKANRRVVKFSILGYSLGGLFARYTVGLLYSKGFFQDVQPVNFATFATPHIGVPRSNGWFSKVAAFIGGRLLGRTGTQLYVRDKGWHLDHSKSSQSVPLLQAMTLPGSNFYKALCRFENVDYYANFVSDLTVPVRTGAVVAVDPWVGWPEGEKLDLAGKGIQVERHPDYPVLLTSVAIPAEPPAKPNLGIRIVQAVVPQKWPWYLNPRKIPWRFPLNYIGVALFPVVLPLFILLIVFRLATATRASNKRVQGLQEDWMKGKGLVEENSRAKYGPGHERDRIASVLRETIQAVAEDNVEVEEHSKENGRSLHLKAPPTSTKSRVTFPHLDLEVSSSTRAYLDSLLPPNSKRQKEMQANLNSIPGLRKHLVFFEDVLNSHALIICRTPSIALHRRGKKVVQHFVDHFGDA